MQILYTTIVTNITLGPANNEFGYNEHPVIANNVFISEKNTSNWHQC